MVLLTLGAVTPMVWWLGGSGLVILLLVSMLAAILIATGKKRIDEKQKRIAEVTALLDQKLGLHELKEPGYDLAVGNLFAAVHGFKKFADKWLTPKAIDDLIVHIICDSLKPSFTNFPEHRIALAKAIAEMLPTMLDDKDTERIIEDVIVQRLSNVGLDDESRGKLIVMAQQIKEWGMDRPAAIIEFAAMHNANAAKATLIAIENDWSTEDGRRAAMRKVLRKLVPHMAENAEDAEFMRGLIPPAKASGTGT